MSARIKIIQSQQHQQQCSALHREPKPSFGWGGVQWGEMAREASPQLHAQLSVTTPGLWPGCNVSMNQTPPSLSLGAHPLNTQMTDWTGTPQDRALPTGTRGGLLQRAAPHRSDVATVTEVATASSCHGMCHRKAHAAPEEQGIDRYR